MRVCQAAFNGGAHPPAEAGAFPFHNEVLASSLLGEGQVAQEGR